MGPHDALGHACRATGIDKEEVIRRAHKLQRRAITAIGQGFKTFGKVGTVSHLDKQFNLGQPPPNGGNRLAEFLTIDHDRCVGIVENVEDLVRRIAVIDIDVGEARLERGAQGFAIFRPVVHIEGDFVAGHRAARQKGLGQIVRPVGRLGPAYHARPMDIGRAIWRKDIFERL